jgi:hypothetical protein
MAAIKVFLICLCIVLYNIENISSHTNTKRDTANEIDPYAAYYEYYANQQTALEELPNAIAANDITEKQGYGLTDMFGPDGGPMMEAIGAVMGTLAAVGVALLAINVVSLSSDQDSICTTVKALGDTSLTTTSTSNMAALDPATATSPTDAEFTAYNALIIARFNLIEAKLNGYATPTC